MLILIKGEWEMQKRIIITVVGEDRVGIIATITGILAQNNINILDIKQTIMQEFFTMILIGDMKEAKINLTQLQQELDQVAEKLNLKITAHNEEIFHFINRI